MGRKLRQTLLESLVLSHDSSPEIVTPSALERFVSLMSSPFPQVLEAIEVQVDGSNVGKAVVGSVESL